MIGHGASRMIASNASAAFISGHASRDDVGSRAGEIAQLAEVASTFARVGFRHRLNADRRPAADGRRAD